MWSRRMVLAALVVLPCGAWGQGEFTQPVLEDAFNRVSPAIVLVRYTSEITNPQSGEQTKRDNNSAGIIVSPGGLVMTHGHMKIENSEPFNISVTVGQGDAEKKYDATLLEKPEDVNVVFLQIKSDAPLRLPHIRFSRSAPLKLGEPVALFGLLGDTLDFNRALWTARIGAIIEKPRRTYCLDGNVRFGFVGGPVVDASGNAVGVIGFDLSTTEGGELYVRSGHPLVYQSALFQRYIDAPPGAETHREDAGDAWLGVFTQPLTEDFSEYWELDADGGLIVSTVVPGSPAARVGLQPGDVITSFADTPIRARQDRDVLGFTKLVREKGAGAKVPVRLLRAGEAMTLEVTLEPRPRTAGDAGEYEDKVFGLTVRELTTDVRIALNLPEDVQGVIVRSVKSGSIAQLGKMRPGVIIMSVGDYPVTSLDSFKEAVAKVAEAKPAEVAVFARVGAATGFFRLQPRWNAGAR